MEYKKEYVDVVERFNAAHHECKVEFIAVTELGVHVYTIEHNGQKGSFTVWKSDAETFERRLNEHLSCIKTQD